MRSVSIARCAFALLVGAIGSFSEAGAVDGAPTQDALIFDSPKTLVETPGQLSPPALQFNQEGHLYVAWFEKQEGGANVKVSRVEGDAVSKAIQVNRDGEGPGAVHQSPGVAVGAGGSLYVTWSSANRTPGAMFASDLRLARSGDGGRTFESPVPVNDDGLPISHSFEDITAVPEGDVYLAWLDGRNKERSGAGILFARSTDHGRSIESNHQIDGMACPCCRPMLAAAPDGRLWVAWRKVLDGNVRDIVIATSADRGRSFDPPRLVRKDNWVFTACPHRGPSLAFDRFGRMYVGWYTEGTDEQPRLFVATSDDQGNTFTEPVSLHVSTTSVPDQLRMAVHPDGAIVAVWEELTGVRKETVMRLSMDRGRSFGPLKKLSVAAKAEHPTVAIDRSGRVALGWSEHTFPMNRLVVQQGQLDLSRITGKP
ncbi:MAG: glycoside hydrolase [Nitrospiraceae bacterium]